MTFTNAEALEETSSCDGRYAEVIERAGEAETGGAVQAEHTERSRRLLYAVEHYKARCASHGEAPTEEGSWLSLLAALRPDPKWPLTSNSSGRLGR